jgi:gamma-glutamylcyclotransferase (GGCT)/AIG2-like uncharacterized protein YtfP
MVKIEQTKNKGHILAVYGTLRKGQGNNRNCLNTSKYIGTTKTKNIFKMFSNGGFPIVSDGDNNIEVDIYEVSDEDLKKVYRLEGYSGVRNAKENWYNTIDVDTSLGSAEMFVMDLDVVENNQLRVIESGNWLDR